MGWRDPSDSSLRRGRREKRTVFFQGQSPPLLCVCIEIPVGQHQGRAVGLKGGLHYGRARLSSGNSGDKKCITHSQFSGLRIAAAASIRERLETRSQTQQHLMKCLRGRREEGPSPKGEVKIRPFNTDNEEINRETKTLRLIDMDKNPTTVLLKYLNDT